MPIGEDGSLLHSLSKPELIGANFVACKMNDVVAERQG
jgi:hypothetical protein